MFLCIRVCKHLGAFRTGMASLSGFFGSAKRTHFLRRVSESHAKSVAALVYMAKVRFDDDAYKRCMTFK